MRCVIPKSVVMEFNDCFPYLAFITVLYAHNNCSYKRLRMESYLQITNTVTNTVARAVCAAATEQLHFARAQTHTYTASAVIACLFVGSLIPHYSH